MKNLDWLGLFSTEPIGGEPQNATDALVGLVSRRLSLPENGRDMVILHHILEARFPLAKESDGSAGPQRERTVATLIEYGEPGGVTAMARTVGLPAALATRLLVDGSLDLTGCHIPTEPAIYEPVLKAMAEEGIAFAETTESIEGSEPSRGSL